MAERDGITPNTTLTLAAVLVPVFRDDAGDVRLVLVLRGARGVHGGQVAFPGGKWEPRDRSLLETAVRETQEEIGLERREIEILAPLEPLDTRSTGFRVHPFLARITPSRCWRPAPGEITDVMTPTLRELSDPAARSTRTLSFATWPGSRSVDCILIEGRHPLWGLTLRVLDPLLPRLLTGEWVI